MAWTALGPAPSTPCQSQQWFVLCVRRTPALSRRCWTQRRPRHVSPNIGSPECALRRSWARTQGSQHQCSAGKAAPCHGSSPLPPRELRAQRCRQRSIFKKTSGFAPRYGQAFPWAGARRHIQAPGKGKVGSKLAAG